MPLRFRCAQPGYQRSNECFTMDLELLRSFVSRHRWPVALPAPARRPPHPVDGEPADQTAEESFGALACSGRQRVAPTEEGERLLSYARRILACEEAATSSPAPRRTASSVSAFRISRGLSACPAAVEIRPSRRGLRLDVRAISAPACAAISRAASSISRW